MSSFIFLPSPTRVYFLLIIGNLFSLLSLSWMWALLPLSWLGFSGFSGYIALGFVIFSISILGAIPFIFFELLFLLQKKTGNLVIVFLFFLFIFLLVELTRAFLLSLFFLGAGSQPSLDWSFLNIGYFISFKPFLGWSILFHVYGLTICFGYLLFLSYLLYTNQRKALTLFLLVFIMTTFIFNIVDDFRYKAAITQDIVVYPEGVESFIEDKNKLYIMGSYELENNKKFNVTNFYFNGQKITTFRKEFLMPFGEYMPILFKPFALLYLNQNKEGKDYAYWEYFRFGYSEGSNHYRVFERNGIRIAVILCSEITSYDILKRIKLEKPDVVYLRGSYIHFNKSPLFYFFLNRWAVTASHYLGLPIIIVKED